MSDPTIISNQALDAIGSDVVLGDIEDGSREAQVLLRAYGQCLRQLLRSHHWNFARKTAPLLLLADATMNSPQAGTQVPKGPWIYEYAYPEDCLLLRFIPWQPVTGNVTPQGNLQPPNAQLPLTSGTANLIGQRLVPARFQIATDFNYLPPQQDGNQPGISPTNRTVILCNVPYAQGVYTAFVPYVSVWDILFRDAMVAYLASTVALAIIKDKKLALVIRKDQMAIAKEKVTEARKMDGNESTSSSDIAVDWMRTRSIGGGFGWNGGGDCGGGGWGSWGGDGMSPPDRSVF